MKTRLALILAIAMLPGCVISTVQTQHYKLTTVRFLWSGELGAVQLTATNAEMGTYKSDAEKTAEAVARGVASGLKP